MKNLSSSCTVRGFAVRAVLPVVVFATLPAAHALRPILTNPAQSLLFEPARYYSAIH